MPTKLSLHNCAAMRAINKKASYNKVEIQRGAPNFWLVISSPKFKAFSLRIIGSNTLAQAAISFCPFCGKKLKKVL